MAPARDNCCYQLKACGHQSMYRVYHARGDAKQEYQRAGLSVRTRAPCEPRAVMLTAFYMYAGLYACTHSC